MSVEDQQIADEIADEDFFEGREEQTSAKVLDQKQAHDEANIFADAIKAIKEERAQKIPQGAVDMIIEYFTHRKEQKSNVNEYNHIWDAKAKLNEAQKKYYSEVKWEQVSPNALWYKTKTETGDEISYTLDAQGKLSGFEIQLAAPIDIEEVKKAGIAKRGDISLLLKDKEKIASISVSAFAPDEKPAVILQGDQKSYLVSEISPVTQKGDVTSALDRFGITPYLKYAPEDIRPKDF